MFSRLHILTFSILILSVSIGCAPEHRREGTELKSAQDVQITVTNNRPTTTQSNEESEESSEQTSQSSQTSEPQPADLTSVATLSPDSSSNEMKPEADSKPETSEEQTPQNSYTGPPKFFGRVTVSGNAPDLAPLLAKGAATKDPICSEQQVPNQSIVVSENGGLANVFVYMKRAPKSGIPEPTEQNQLTRLIDQEGCVFMPHAAVVRVGQSITMKNSDPVAHNVNVKARQEGYNSVVPANGTTEHTFRFAENLPASTVCDFHTFMSAWILPVEHPWATVTDEDGRFEIPNLPEGEWDFVIWHEAVGYVERAAEVKAAANKAIEMNFEVPASKFSQ